MMMKGLLRASTAALMLAPTPLLAQSAATPPRPPASDGNGQLEDIVVTAQKRSENLQSVPISVAAFSGATLTRLGVQNTLDVPNVVPGFVLTKSFNIALPYIRGVGQSSATTGIESNVALYIDGVYLSEPASGVFELNNIAQVEVLKGPQGTLFGRNSTGGVVHVITRDPSFTPALDADVAYGNYNTFKGHLFATAPLSDTLAASIALAGMDRTEGYGYDVSLNKKIFTAKSFNVQGKLLWRPATGTAITLNVLHSYGEGYVGSALGIYPGSLAENHQTRFISEYVIAGSLDPISSSEHTLASLKIEQNLGGARIVNITAYRDYNEVSRFTQNAIPNGTVQATNAVFPSAAHSFSEEFQIQSPAGAKVQWIAGLFYLYDRASFDGRVAADTIPIFSVNSYQDTNSYSAFAQATVPITNSLRLTGGGRYTIDEKSVVGTRYNGAGVATSTFASALGALGQPTAKTWKSPTWRVSLDQDLGASSMVYASYNRGFKSGVYSLLSPTNPPANPETLDAYEIGIKNTFFDRRLRLNLSGFYYNYKNIQLRSLVPPSPVPIVYNAARSHIKGLDIDIEALPAKRLTVTAGFELLDAKYVSFPGAACPLPAAAGGNPTTISCDLSGNRMIRSPKFTGNLGFQYEFGVGNGGNVTFSANDHYNSGFFWEPDNRLVQPPYHEVSASIRYALPGHRWSIAIWGKNLAGENIYVNAAAASSDTYAPGEPRTFGATLSVKLGG